MRSRSPFLRTGAVKKVLRRRAKAADLLVEVGGRQEQAVNYEDLTGKAAVGDSVLLNVSAVSLGLGTGGRHIVVANLTRPETDVRTSGRGMKLRYSPFQRPVELVEEAHPEAFSAPGRLEGMPVILASLHSLAVACVIGLRWLKQEARVAFLMDDSASLVAGFGDALGRVEKRGMATTITVGQAFGGQIEAVNVYSGLLAARHVVGAEVAVVGPGPGHLGTGTSYGFSSISMVEAANAAGALGGTPVLVPRLSFADPRKRHRGVSHHTLTLLSLCLSPLLVPFPLLSEGQKEEIAGPWRGLGAKHRQLFADGGFIGEALEDFGGLSSMGRSYSDDPCFFEAAGAAARVAVDMGNRREQRGAPTRGITRTYS